jgi:glycosyltransferase involved in cell wall biosynthesis
VIAPNAKTKKKAAVLLKNFLTSNTAENKTNSLSCSTKPYTFDEKSYLASLHLKLLLKMDYEVHLITETVSDDATLSSDIHHHKITKLPFGDKIQNKFFNYGIQKILDAEKFSLIFGYGDYNNQNIIFINDNDLISKIKNFKYRLAILSSMALKKELGPDAEGEILYTPYDKEIFNNKNKVSLRESGRSKLALAHDTFALGITTPQTIHVTDLITQVLNSLLIMKITHKIHLFVECSENQKALFEIAIQKITPNFTFSFLPSNFKTEEFYHSLDSLISFSHRACEDISSLEAMACGTPVVVSKDSKMSELLLSKQLVKDFSKTEELSTLLTELVENLSWRISISKQNSERATHFDENYYYKKLLDALSKIVH